MKFTVSSSALLSLMATTGKVISNKSSLPILEYFLMELKDGKLTVKCSGGKHNLIRVMDYINQNDIPCGRVYSELPTLNDVFLELTGKELRD